MFCNQLRMYSHLNGKDLDVNSFHKLLYAMYVYMKVSSLLIFYNYNG